MDPNIAQPTTPLAQTPVPQATEPIQPVLNTSSGKTKYLLLAILILLVLVVLGGGAYYLGIVKQQPLVQKNNNTATTQIPTPTTASTPTATAQSTATPDPTANWKTYIGTAYSFKYPADWKIVPIPPNQIAVTNSEAEAVNQKEAGDCRSFYPIVVSDETGLISSDRFDNTNTQTVTSNPTTISGNEATSYNVDSTLKACQDWNTGKSEAITVNYNGKKYLLNLKVSDNPTYKKVFDFLLPTFKFTDQNQTSCNTDSDCQNGANCTTVGPIIANQPVHKVCVQQGQAAPQ